MYRTHTCGELRIDNTGTGTTLAGWVQKVRNLGAMTFIDLRDRYGITQLVVDENTPAEVRAATAGLGREYVIQATGTVRERSSKNLKIPTGDIEVAVSALTVLNRSEVPPFTIEEHSDGGDDLRMKYRYLDLRRPPLQRNILLRHRMAQSARRFLDGEGFLEIETPFLIRSTPEGARDFVVPSRMNPGEFYALPQSPQTFKQLLMVSGYDRYFQIVRCFRDEDLRADRQPEFTQIDCEMSFVEQEDVLEIFERFAKYLFRETLGIEFGSAFPRIPWSEAMARYGSDKPDIRFGMEINDLSDRARGRGFAVFDSAEYVGGIVATGCAGYTRKQIDELTEFVKRPQVGAKGLVWIRLAEDGSVKSSIDKFFPAEELLAWAAACGAAAGDLLLLLAGALLLPGAQTNNGCIYLPLSPGALLAGAGGVVLAVQGVLRFLGRGGGQVFPARLTVADTALDVRAFCDTGFSVQEPLSGRAVVLVRFGAVQSRLPPALGTYLEQHFAGAAPLPVPALGVRLVPCTTVAGHCILPAVPASLCCTGSPAGQGRAEHLYAAFADLPPPPDGWEVLVGVEAGDHFQQAHPLSHD